MYQTAGHDHGLDAPPSGRVYECVVCDRLIQEERRVMEDGESLVCSPTCETRWIIETTDWQRLSERESAFEALVERGDEYVVSMRLHGSEDVSRVWVVDVDLVNRTLVYADGRVQGRNSEHEIPLTAIDEVHVSRARRISA